MSGEHRGFVVLSALAVIVLLLLTRGAWFWRDEWMFIRGRSFGDPATWFLPHVEHFVALHAAVYTALLAVFGTSTYLPFLAVLSATHVAFVAANYVLIDRHVGRGPALAAAAYELFLGSAGLNLFWAFQMGPIASGALAMWGLVVIRRRPGLAAVLMGLGAATAGFAFFFVPAAALYGWSRRALLASAVPLVVYGSWYLVIGRRLVTVHDASPTLGGAVNWLTAGVVVSTDAVTSLGTFSTFVLLLALVLSLRLPDRRLGVVGLIGLLTEYVILGLSRSGMNTPAGWQYLYFGAPFVILVFASAWPAVPRWGRPAVGLLATMALIINIVALVAWSAVWVSFMAANDPLCSLC
jgi:hypothetical protein